MRKKKILLIILPILLVLIVVGVVAILYFSTDIFKSNDSLFAKYFMQNEDILDIMKNDNADKQNNFKYSNSYISDGELLVTVQNGANIQKIKATTASRHDMNTGRTYAEMNLKNAEADLLKVSYINSDDVHAIKCDDILGNYIGVRNSDLKAFARNMGLSETEIANIPDSIDLEAISNLTKITEEQKQHIIDTYSKAIIESISKERFSKTKDVVVTKNGTNYKTNAYMLGLDENTTKQIIINCLNKLKEDNTTLSIISNKLSILGTEYTDNISTIIDNLITELQSSETTNNEIIKITVYEYKGKTIKTDISLLEDGQEVYKMSICIDNSNNVQTANIIIESLNDSEPITLSGSTTNTDEVYGVMNNSNDTTTAMQVSQITLKKTTTDTNIVSETTFVPNTNNMAQYINMNNSVGKIQNNTTNNTSEITISNSSDGINVETINASYIQNIQAVEQVTEIMKLKNSNTIILNNYTIEQLTPFLTSVGNKISQVIPTKIEQLGIGIQSNNDINNTNEISNIASTTNTIIRSLQVVGAAGLSIGNANGIDVGYVAGVGIIGMGIYVYNIASSTIGSMDTLEGTIEMQENTEVDIITDITNE